MVEISKSGSGEGLGWVTDRGYSTVTGLRQTGLGGVRARDEKADPLKIAALPKTMVVRLFVYSPFWGKEGLPMKGIVWTKGFFLKRVHR
jgi:hypothetical protein